MASGINFNPVANTSSTVSASRKEANEKAGQVQDNGKEKEVVAKQDGWESKGKQTPPVTYGQVAGNKKASSSEIEALRSKANQATENLRKLVEELILKQTKGHKTFLAIQDELKGAMPGAGASSEVEEAQQAISENGPWGVNAVSDRLVDFAIAISGGDKSKFGELVAAIDKGFAAAREAWGGELPEISQKTYTETMRKLEAWAKGTETETE